MKSKRRADWARKIDPARRPHPLSKAVAADLRIRAQAILDAARACSPDDIPF